MGYKKPCYKNSINGTYHFVLVIQIRRVEGGKEYLVLVDSKKDKEERKTFFSKTENKREERRRLSVR